MSDAVSGLLGGIIGTSHAVSQLSEERRHEMALNLRREALADLEKKSSERRHGQNKETQKINIAADKEEGILDRTANKEGTDAGIKSREKIASEQNTVRKEIAAEQNKVRREIAAVEKGSAKAQRLRAENDAWKQALKVMETGGTIDEQVSQINSIMENYGKTFEKRVVEEGDSGILGTGIRSKEAVYGIFRAGGGSPGEPIPVSGGTTPVSGKGKYDDMVADGRKIMDKRKEKTETAPMVAQGPEQLPESKGIISQAQAAVPARNQDLGDPSTWDVQKQSGQYFLMTADGPVKMTEKQISQWRAATGKK
jgi:hypothetical protein